MDIKISSDDIIASLLKDFQHSNKKFDVNSLLKKNKKKISKVESEIERPTTSKEEKPGRERERCSVKKDKSNREKERRTKKNKKSSKNRSKSPKKKNKRSKEDKKLSKSKVWTVKDQIKSDKIVTIPKNEVRLDKRSGSDDKSENDLQKLRDKLLAELKEEEQEQNSKVPSHNIISNNIIDDDEIPLGTDAQSWENPLVVSQQLNDYIERTCRHQNVKNDKHGSLSPPNLTSKIPDSFPLSKSGDAMARKPSDVLSKVIEKSKKRMSSGFLPRNVKINREHSHDIKEEALKKIQIMQTGKQLDFDDNESDLLKGPIRRKFGTDRHLSDEDDELRIAPIEPKHQPDSKLKRIVIRSLKTDDLTKRPIPELKHYGEEGEIVHSDHNEDEDSSSEMDIGDSDGEIVDEDKRSLAEVRKRSCHTRVEARSSKKLTRRTESSSGRRRSRKKSMKRRSSSRSRSITPMDKRGRHATRPRKQVDRRRRPPTDKDRQLWPWGQGASRKSPSRRHIRSHVRRSRSPSRSRSRSRSMRRRRSTNRNASPTPRDKDGHIDKKKLFDIARRNASAMLQVGTLHQIKSMNVEEIAKLKAGGRSVDELVDYCKKLQKRQDRVTRREAGQTVSSSDSEGNRSEDDLDFINHPFELKPNPGIILNIPNAVPLPVKTPQQRKFAESQLRITYPVSSGQQHKDKTDEWTPVEKPQSSRAVPSVCCDEEEKRKLAVPPAYKEKAAALSSSLASSSNSLIHLLPLPPPPPPPPPAPPAPPASPPPASTSSQLDRVFPDAVDDAPTDISYVVSQRLQAIKRLHENPNDLEALKLMHLAEQQMKKWAESKNLPGQFTGNTGVQCLSTQELAPVDPRFNSWPKKDLFRQANKLQSGIGMHLMQKMGWKPGEGLGKDRGGAIEPLSLDIKSDRKGLVAIEEMPAGIRKPGVTFATDMNGKHPVSVLMELCSKRRWGPPQFTCIETGPTNNRRFLWKTIVNGIEYQPAVPSSNKKIAKAQSAQVVLQSLGLVPQDASLPITIS